MTRSQKGLREPYARIASELLERLLEIHGDNLVSLVVYGSVARGEARRDSDLDLLVVFERLPRSRLERIALFEEAEKRIEPLLDSLLDEGYAVALSPVIKTREEASRISPLYLDMVEDAVILYDKGGFFASVLERLRKRLEELGAERVRLGRKWYWRLKRDARFGEVIELA